MCVSISKFLILVALVIVLAIDNALSSVPHYGPSNQPEAYLNGSSYVRLLTTISLKKQTGISFRTCFGGNLFSQQQKDEIFELVVKRENIIFFARTSGKTFEERISGNYTNNKWHTVYLQYMVGNLTIRIDDKIWLLANASYNHEVLTSPGLYNEGAAVLLIGKQFNGCIQEGPSIVFDKNIISYSQNVIFAPCPLTDDSCTPTEEDQGIDICLNKPCFNQGTCINDKNGYTCTCHPKYTGKNCEIDLGDPCEKIPPICQNNAQCELSTYGEYVCTCPPNYTGQHCEDKIIINPQCEGSNNPCLNDGICSVSEATNKVVCSCKPGFKGSICEINLDECFSSPCKNGGLCIDGYNNYTCNCAHTGYTGRLCEKDIDECLNKPCQFNGICFNTHGSYLCQCMPRYGGQNCEYNVNECQSQPCYNRGTCLDKPGGYECRCPPGFLGDNCEVEMRNEFCTPQSCAPYGECSNNGNFGSKCFCKLEHPGVYPNCTVDPICIPNPCRNGGICTGSHLADRSSYNCSCLPGFSGPACERVDLCEPGFCRNGGTCSADAYGYVWCVCADGWTGTNCETQLRCENLPCAHSVSCQDYLVGYYCTCEPGWTGMNCNVQLDHCSSSPCLNGATCTDRSDYFTCHCAQGYTGRICQVNMDECLSSPCLNGGVCIDKINDYSCNCTSDWMGPRCQKPYDACGLNPCLNNATCILGANKHSFMCNCSLGFEGERCEINVDDCNDVKCLPGKVCVDLVNSYECRCPSGYGGDNCTIDLDPCAREPCSNNGVCTVDKVTPHHFTCSCPPGYMGEYCDQDIDECAKGKNICNNGICINVKGGFQCYCKPGFTGERCNLDFDECLSMPCQNNATCLNKINKYECVCPAGYSGKDCSININECNSNPCIMGSTCVDGINAYTCLCQPGLTGLNCEINKDDCESSPCQHNSICIDGLNSYTCNCTDTGYTGIHCEINIDDCLSNPCTNDAECIDLVKGYQCKCHNGYTGTNCEEDLNECDSNPCQFNGTCLERSNQTLYRQNIMSNFDRMMPEIFEHEFEFNNAAGYECVCIPGITGKNCEIDIDECQSSPCIHGKCEDVINGFQCNCEEGFEGTTCNVDIDECLKYHPCANGTCVDKRADYFCNCDQNYGGKNCSVLLIGCLNNPCMHNGVCKPFLYNETTHKFNCSCDNGFYGPTCEKITTMSLSKSSQITVNTTPREEGYDIQFRLKTSLGDGLLAIGKGFTYYILELSRGRLNLQSSLLNKWEGAFVGSSLNNSEWQRVFVAINSTHLVLAANDEQTINVINFNENANSSLTTFPVTYIGGIPNNLRKLTHSQPFLVGCIEDVLINGEWILPEEENANISLKSIENGCQRKPQCTPNPCQSGGHCTDEWREFSCTCKRPYLGNTCQYNFTAATFGYENITDSLVTVTVSDYARRAVKNVIDISMFIKTRQPKGQIFYLGSGISNSLDDSYISAQLEGGELLVRIQFNGSFESYAVGGVHLDNGYNQLIEVVRNTTLVQVKLNGTEYFRKTLPATATLDAQVLFLGGQPQVRSIRQAENLATLSKPDLSPSVSTTAFNSVHFKGIIQDVQISNGSYIMVVEFFPLEVEELNIPPSFGMVDFSEDLVKRGILTDDMCRSNPCMRGGTCEVTWNDYTCHCLRGSKGKNCNELEFCEIETCPSGSECKNLEDGFECISNASFDATAEPLRYSLTVLTNSTKSLQSFGHVQITYRTRSWGTLFFVKSNEDYFIVFVYHNYIVVEWNLGDIAGSNKFKKDNFEGQWLTLLFNFKESTFRGGFQENVQDENPNIDEQNFNSSAIVHLLTRGEIYLAGSDEKTFDYQHVIDKADNTTGYIPVSDSTTEILNSNSLESIDMNRDEVVLYRVDKNKKTDKFKGCLGEVRIGGLLLPFFTKKELSSNKNYSKEFYDLVSENKPNINCTLCYDTDCFNNGRCRNTEATYQCECPDGYAADDCSIDINECLDNKCQNNATCVDLVAKYRCDCQLGYEGVHCEKDINECLSNPCRHGGTCIDLIGTFKCNCPEDFVGKQCEAPLLITCDNRPCKDGATCEPGANKVTGNNFTCICTDGMEGPLCDTPFCHLKECVHGFCNTTEEVPFCSCEQGFEGKYCEHNIDDCVLTSGGSPCQNGGVCIDGINRYNCNCTETGYSGLLCEWDINECEYEDPACGLGKCQNTPGDYICDCRSIMGKCGHGCSLDDPCVQENPCIHGECVSDCSYKPDYKCHCVENYDGKNCTNHQLAASAGDGGFNILYVVVPLVLIVFVGLAIGMVILVNVARSKRATRGTYSPSAQEFCNPRVELDHVLKPPPEERLI